MKTILDEIKVHLSSFPTRKAQIILDIDDTLIDCRHRKHRVFQDFLREQSLWERYPRECEKLQMLSWESVCYRIDDNLKSAKIENLEFGQLLLSFWRQHYFTYPYLLEDRAFPGALRFVEDCRALGLQIVYLTGRDTPGMGPGTFAGMKKLGFPTEGEDIFFYLKPEAHLDDYEFKKSALEQLTKHGPVIAALENELGNLNAMAERFEEALVYWRPTLYAPNPPLPHPRVRILTHFPDK